MNEEEDKSWSLVDYPIMEHQKSGVLMARRGYDVIFYTPISIGLDIEAMQIHFQEGERL